MSEYEIIDVDDLPGNRGGAGRAGLNDAFRNLPAGKALFVPRDQRDWQKLRSQVTANLARIDTTRSVHVRTDRDKDGVWVWWAPRNGSHPS